MFKNAARIVCAGGIDTAWAGFPAERHSSASAKLAHFLCRNRISVASHSASDTTRSIIKSVHPKAPFVTLP